MRYHCHPKEIQYRMTAWISDRIMGFIQIKFCKDVFALTGSRVYLGQIVLDHKRLLFNDPLRLETLNELTSFP
jgi:hypothetical protein